MKILFAAVVFLLSCVSAAAQSRPVWKLLREDTARKSDMCPDSPVLGRSGHARIYSPPDPKTARLLRELKTLGKRLRTSHRNLLKLHPQLRTGAVFVRRNPRAVYQDGHLIFRNERAHAFFEPKGALLCFTMRADISSVRRSTPAIHRVLRVYFGQYSRGRGLPLMRMEYRRGRRRFEVNKGRVHARVRLRALRLTVRGLREVIFAADRAASNFVDPDL